MIHCRGPRILISVTLFFIFLHSLILSDFWIPPAVARYSGCPFGGPSPDPETLTWLPYRTFCSGVQTMSSLPSWLIIDDYPETDIPDCAEIRSEAFENQLQTQSPGCRVDTVTDIMTNVILDQPFICNGNVSPGYWVGYYLESYTREYEVECDGGSPSRILNTIGSKYFVREPIGPNEVLAARNRGTPQCGLSAGNPINIATGNKYHRQQDSVLPGGLEIIRHYNSSDSSLRSFGVGWRGNFSRKIIHTWSPAHPDVAIAVVRDDGSENYWHVEGMVPVAPVDAAGQLEIAFSNGSIIGYTYTPNDNSVETYDARGRLISVENGRGQTLSFSYADLLLATVATASGRELNYEYEASGRVSRITSTDGSGWNYFYDSHGNLVQIEYPDGAIKTYQYENTTFPNALTGESDERGNRIRSWAYDASGRAILSAHGAPASQVRRNEIVYNPDGSSTILDPLQNSVDHHFENIHGVAKFKSVNEVCAACDNSTQNISYDLNGNKDIVTDFNGNRSDYDYTADNLLQKVTYAAGTTNEYQVSYQWDPDIRKPTEITRPGQSLAYIYNSRGQLLTRTESDLSSRQTRSWTYTWFESPAMAPLIGRIQAIDGPREDAADITTFEYYSSDHPDGDYLAGDLKAVINALGHRTEYLKYDGNGRPLDIQDANSVLTSMTYHPRGWLETRTTDGRTTVFGYDIAGNLTRLTQADGSFTTYEYDELNRMTAIADNFNNRVEYTLDAMGQRTAEHTFDNAGVLRHQLNRVYDQLSRLEKLIDGNQDQTEYRFDDNGNRTALVDPNLNQTDFEYDALNRMVKAIDALAGDTTMTYDARDNLVSVTDPMANTTQYSYSGFNQQIQANSPDSGITTWEFDEAGNRTAMIDARGIRTEYSYDSLNRLTSIRYPDSSLNVDLSYDLGTNGTGRLTGMTDAAGDVEFAYDARGNLISETRTIGGVRYDTAYTYNDADRLVRIMYPSGMQLNYELDSAGRIVVIDKIDGPETEVLVSDIQYEPFGPVRAFTYGNGLTWSAIFNQDYELERLRSGAGGDRLLDYDRVGNLLSITDQNDTQNGQSFTYDSLYRLETAEGAYGVENFEYDANGNRLRYQKGALDITYSYQDQTNRLDTQGSRVYERDAAGNRTAGLDGRDDGQLFVYADHNRLIQASIRTADGDTIVADYVYDGRGQRLAKTAGGETVHYIYSQSGELLGEYSAGASERLTEYIYLNGQPVAMASKKTDVYQPPGDELILDNGEPGTASSGSWQTKSNKLDYGPDYLFANKSANRSYRWSATPPGNKFQVYAWWVSGKSFSSQVAYTIAYGDGETDKVSRSHKSGGGQWQLLGTYHSTGGQYHVEVSSPDNKFVADAIRWVELHEPFITTTTSTHFIHGDHIGIPRRVTDQAQTIVWSWHSRPFGNSPPNEDPDGDLKNFTLNLRFPGQYYDAETKLHYNYFRTYDPETGRYLESDPIGLNGGPNVFTYAENVPVQFIDPRGLLVTGDWIKEPRLNLTDYGITGANIIAPYFNEWSYLKLFRLYGFATGFVNIDVQCTDTEACDKREWEIHQQIDVSYHGYKDIGPNTAAVGASSFAGPLAGSATGIITLGGSALTGLLDFLKEIESRGGDKIKWLYHLGPSAICVGTSE